jgi:lysophospholipase L1-like esterase
MDSARSEVREPAKAGSLVRALGTVVPGMRRSADQISDDSTEWQRRNERAITSDLPLWVALGVGASSIDQGYISLLGREDLQHHALMNFSASGAKINDVIVNQLPLLDLLPRDASLVTCTVGSNDLLRSLSIGAARRSIDLLISRLPHSTVIATVPDRGSLMAKKLNRAITASARDRGMRVARVNEHMTSWKGYVAGDGFHPNDNGYQRWATAFRQALAEPVPG